MSLYYLSVLKSFRDVLCLILIFFSGAIIADEKMKEFDTNRDGTVDQKEFQQGLSRMGIFLSNGDTRIVFNALMKECGVRDGNAIDYKTLSQKLKEDLVKKYQEGQVLGVHALSAEERKQHLIHSRVVKALSEKGKQLSKIFATFDEDGDGSIDFGEFTRGIKDAGIFLSDGDARSLFDSCDNDGDGTIDLDEFRWKLSAEDWELDAKGKKWRDDRRGQAKHLRSNSGFMVLYM